MLSKGRANIGEMRHQPRRLLGRAAGRRGFTLVEVLVVLAIMVILFGLLFAPMITGLNLVRRGKRHVAMQDAVRLALEQMKRELGDAVYVFDPEVLDVASVDGNAVSMKVADYSMVTFAPPQRDALGQLVSPVRPEVLMVFDAVAGANVRCFRAARYRVHLANDALDPVGLTPLVPHGEDNPFALFREEGYVRENPSTPGQWVWWKDNVLSKNALTPRSGTDLTPSVSICESCGSMWTGYAPKCLNSGCPDAGTTVGMRYITEGIQFAPKRVTGELLTPSADGTLYRARWGGWLGEQNAGNVVYTTGILPLPSLELNPHLAVYRYDATPGVQEWAVRVLDTTETPTTPDPDLKLRWSSGAGSVRFGEWYSTGAVFDVGSDPGGAFYPLSIDADPTDGLSPDTYNGMGALTSGAAYTQDLYPVYPPKPVFVGDARAPMTYVIEPTMNGAQAPAKVVPETISVRLLVQFGSGAAPYRYYNLQPTSNYDQDKIGRWQFCPYPSADYRSVQVRFNRNDPPSADWFGGTSTVTGFAIEVTYYARRNFDPASNNDDIVAADYSTRYMMNICLTLGAYVELDPSLANPDVFVLPTDVRLHRIQARDQVVIRNAVD